MGSRVAGRQSHREREGVARKCRVITTRPGVELAESNWRLVRLEKWTRIVGERGCGRGNCPAGRGGREAEQGEQEAR